MTHRGSGTTTLGTKWNVHPTSSDVPQSTVEVSPVGKTPELDTRGWRYRGWDRDRSTPLGYTSGVHQ